MGSMTDAMRRFTEDIEEARSARRTLMESISGETAERRSGVGEMIGQFHKARSEAHGELISGLRSQRKAREAALLALRAETRRTLEERAKDRAGAQEAWIGREA